MTYDIQIGNTIHRGLSYEKLITFPINSFTLIRRNDTEWIYATQCIELSHIISDTHERISVASERACPTQYSSPLPEITSEQVFIPENEYFKYRQKRKAAVIGICTLGLAGLSLIGTANTWNNNIFAGTSFSANDGIGFILKCLSFIFLTISLAIPYFIYSVFASIYYSIRLLSMKR